MSPKPTAILQITNIENQNMKTRRSAGCDIDEKQPCAAGDDKARIKYRIKTHPNGI